MKTKKIGYVISLCLIGISLSINSQDLERKGFESGYITVDIDIDCPPKELHSIIDSIYHVTIDKYNSIQNLFTAIIAIDIEHNFDEKEIESLTKCMSYGFLFFERYTQLSKGKKPIYIHYFDSTTKSRQVKPRHVLIHTHIIVLKKCD